MGLNFGNWSTLWSSLQGTLGQHIPQLAGALAIFLIGLIVAALLKGATRKGLAALGVNRRMGATAGPSGAGPNKVDVENTAALIVFWAVMLLTLTAVFNALDLSLVSGSFASLNTQVLEYLPRLLGAVLLALVAWLVATVLRVGTQKLLDRTTLDEKLSEHANLSPLSDGLSNALFWLVILLFVPAILGVLQMDGLLTPLRDMLSKALDMLPNIVAALILGGIGWLLATVLRNLTSNLLRSAGVDSLGSKAGLSHSVQLSNLAGLLVFIAVFVPALIAALDALQIEAISGPATDMLAMLLDAVPRIIAAGMILLVTWLVAGFVTRLLASLLANVGFDSLPARLNMAHAFEGISPSALIGRIALLFAMLFAVVEAGNQLGFERFADMIGTFIEFSGDVLLGSAILVIGFMLANVAHTAITRASGKPTALAKVARFAILGIVLAMGLRAMGIADDIVNLAFGLTLGAVAVAIALAFGLGGREAASRLANHWVERLCREQAAPPAAPTAAAVPVTGLVTHTQLGAAGADGTSETAGPGPHTPPPSC